MLQTILLVAQVFVSLTLIGLVLLQKGKGADAGAGFGAGASGTVFGAKGSASFLSRATAILAAVFIVNSLALANLAGTRTAPDSVMESQAPTEGELPGIQGLDLPEPDAPIDAEMPQVPAPVAETDDDELPQLEEPEPKKEP